MLHKLNVLYKEFSKDVMLSKYFGVLFGLENFVCSCIFRGGRTKTGKKLSKDIYDYVEQRLTKDHADLIERYKNIEITSPRNVSSEKLRIWLFWWQGLENAPHVIKACIKALYDKCREYDVVIISEHNLEDYVKFPVYIKQKFEKGIITLTHLSDLLRLSLLWEYGGIWMDATLLMTDSFPKDLYKRDFYTLHHNMYSDYHICKGKWSGFFLKANKNNPLIGFCREFMWEYWKKEKYLICYLLIDVGFSIAYNNFLWAKKMIDEVPINCTDVFKMQENMNKPFNEKRLKIWKQNTFLHKLSYKRPFKCDNDGNQTFWDYITKLPEI